MNQPTLFTAMKSRFLACRLEGYCFLHEKEGEFLVRLSSLFRKISRVHHDYATNTCDVQDKNEKSIHLAWRLSMGRSPLLLFPGDISAYHPESFARKKIL